MAFRHFRVFSDPHSYCAHPHVLRAADGTLVAVVNLAPRRAVVLHPPEDPFYRNVIVRSGNDGDTWSAPEVVPGFAWSGMECAGLTLLPDGRLMLNQWQFDWHPLGAARRLPDQTGLRYPQDLLARWHGSPEHDPDGVDLDRVAGFAPWVRGGGRTVLHFSDDHGISFAGRVDPAIAPFCGGYGMRGGVVLPDGRILLPLSDVPDYQQVFTIESRDGGATWAAPRLVAGGIGHAYEEPAILRCADGKLLMILRDNETRRLHRCLSFDLGASWTMPDALDIEGYPAHLLALNDGHIVMTCGWRQPGYGIRAFLSEDGGLSWQTDRPIVVRGDLRNRNLGYPSTVTLPGGRLLTLYYAEGEDGVTGIEATVWTV